jgi:aminoglycoside phosphotransferase family enzyme
MCTSLEQTGRTALQPNATPSPEFIAALRHPDPWPHPAATIELIETHISWVFLTGEYAYKIKKPVNFGFLDFSSLDKRLHCCREEVRLNRRLAPGIYLDVVPLTGRPANPRVNGKGEAFEYAVRMKQFDVHRGFDHLLASGQLTEEHMDRTAAMLATFQAGAEVAPPESDYGTITAVRAPIAENFTQIEPYLRSLDGASQLQQRMARLERWSADTARRLEPALARRRASGFIREGHGDLHLRNIIDWHGEVVPFDCIEFNPGLRWIDVVSELAFLLMDLDDHRHQHLSRRLLSSWLEYTGDYEGLELLRFYQVYRAMVRAKVASLRLAQSASAAGEARDFSDYVTLAESYTEQRPVRLLITHGLSGSGKTRFSRRLLEATPIIRLRSDVERKRLFGVAVTDHGAAESRGLYRAEASHRTYQHLRDTAKSLLQWGFSVVVDAAFLKREQRDRFASLAGELEVPFAIVHCEADEATARARLRRRQSAGKDASDADVAIFEQQRIDAEPLADTELDHRMEPDLEELLGWIA